MTSQRQEHLDTDAFFHTQTQTKSMLKFVYSLTRKSVMEANPNKLSVFLKLTVRTQ